MLSKSQARLFFLLATAGFSLVFLWLTVDTIRQVPARSNEVKMDASVVRGKMIWEKNNCMGCHTLLGEGAYYAPELTKVVQRRGEAWMRLFLKDPQAMFPGKRKMIQYNFSDEQITDVIHFFKWIGEIDTNGFPADPDLAPKKTQVSASSAPAGAAKAAIPKQFTRICIACHAFGGKGGNVGPALDGVATRFTADELDIWLKNPSEVKPGTAMPNLHLDDATRAELVSWLTTLK